MTEFFTHLLCPLFLGFIFLFYGRIGNGIQFFILLPHQYVEVKFSNKSNIRYL